MSIKTDPLWEERILELKATYPRMGDIRIQAMLEQERRGIDEAFFVDLFRVLVENPTMTAITPSVLSVLRIVCASFVVPTVGPTRNRAISISIS